MVEYSLHPARRHHLDVLRGPFGIWQHAAGAVPDEAHGSCTDDVARALTVDLLHARELGWDVVRSDAWRSITFLGDAQNNTTGAFRNFRSADGTWLEPVGSADSQGRAILALGSAVANAPDPEMAAMAGRLLVRALPTARGLVSLRATASALLGCAAAVRGGLLGETEATLDALAGRLRLVFSTVDLDSDWPWPEPVLTYENALLPRALIVAGEHLGDRALLRSGLRVLAWLLEVQRAPNGAFAPVGCTGWWPRGGTCSRFDQQPIEATATILAAAAAMRATGDPQYRRAAEAAYAWFLGANALRVPVALPATGGCQDGLTPTGANRNQGAESTLMWLTALEEIRSMRSERATVVPGGARPARTSGPSYAGVLT